MTLPPVMALDQAGPASAFRVVADKAALWFEPGGRHLIVSFDNLATVDDPYPRVPWLGWRIAQMGHALLGVQTFAKDWYRNADAEPLIRGLQATGFFAQFDRVIFIGASMGAFGAINLATLVPGAAVIAASPQSTMQADIAPFEARFPWAVRHSDWTTTAFLDAALSARHLERVVLLYDGTVPEDRLHALRLKGPNVQMLRIDDCTHEAIRVVLKCDALAPLIAEVIATGCAGDGFWHAMHGRRTVRKWARTFMTRVVADGHPARIRAVANRLLTDGGYLFARHALDALDHPGGEDPPSV